jgi:hypothetical protein
MITVARRLKHRSERAAAGERSALFGESALFMAREHRLL